MQRFLQRYGLWGILVLILLGNAVVYWPAKKSKVAGRFSGPPAGDFKEGKRPEPTAEMKARFEAMVAKMSEADRKAFEERRKADDAFFESIKNLPEEERRQKRQEYRAQNPPPKLPEGMGAPPAGGAGGPGGDGGSGGPGGGNGPHIPPVDVRRGMDATIVNAQKGAK